MHFDDGENPWLQTENFIKIFNWDFYKSGSDNVRSIGILVMTSCAVHTLLRLF